MIAGPWTDRAAFETWWTLNVRALNRLSVADPREYERVCQAIEEFNRSNPQ